MDLQPFPPAQTHAASCSICSVDLEMSMDVGHVLVRFHQSLCLAYLSLPTDREHLRQRRPCSGTKRVEDRRPELRTSTTLVLICKEALDNSSFILAGLNIMIGPAISMTWLPQPSATVLSPATVGGQGIGISGPRRTFLAIPGPTKPGRYHLRRRRLNVGVA